MVLVRSEGNDWNGARAFTYMKTNLSDLSLMHSRAIINVWKSHDEHVVAGKFG